ncbi:CAF17-like 4Fe-4S cluster assembly/insertion protein YgfZ [Ramlibacter alkalitolerans]|uniref:Folate-binding protein YgfZ n=1 Tax=Ramlibacter alkalitolerans TaxID=2039631 RepID=A0ABS1JTJ7_9BURK|nr:folate-binding protein YgfZ [Ramlibacter alkalitolerans]MBL0427598.1 folate-binding protein YgfZ [Ramlibacter alkalitolerans]
MSHPLNGVAPLPHLGVIRAHGAEAASFLHSQLTQDFTLLGPTEARLAALCTAKGRMLASFIAVRRAADDILLVCSRDVLPATLKRLSMFVLRAKVKLSDASGEQALYGLLGEAAAAADAPWSVREAEGGWRVQLYPADGQPRALWVGPAGAPPPAGPELDPAVWQWAEVRSGVATITQPIVEAFVPQMLNYESVGGVNFKKGCYPGQEVVARSQFRGTLKRRAFVAHSEAELAAGQEVFRAAEPEQPAGIVAEAARSPAGGWDAIVSLQLAAVEAGDLHAASADGPALQLLPLPYRLLEDV